MTRKRSAAKKPGRTTTVDKRNDAADDTDVYALEYLCRAIAHSNNAGGAELNAVEAFLCQNLECAFDYARTEITRDCIHEHEYNDYFPCGCDIYFNDRINGQWGDAEAYILDYLCAAIKNANTNSENGFEGTEAFIREHLSDALDYAKVTVGGGWKGAETVLLETSPPSALRYARDVLGRRWPEGEEIIRSDDFAACEYARTVIKGRWHEAEDCILQNLEAAVFYARDVIGGRWKELEKYLKKSASDHGIGQIAMDFRIDLYAREVLWEDWSSCQDIICDHPNWLYMYFNSLGGKAPLPVSLHNVMFLYYLEDPENEYVRYYFRDLSENLPT